VFHAVSGPTLTASDPRLSQGMSYGIYGGQSGTVAGFLRVLRLACKFSFQ
jgi:hypothetical protein